MEDDLNFLENGRWPQFIENGRRPQICNTTAKIIEKHRVFAFGRHRKTFGWSDFYFVNLMTTHSSNFAPFVDSTEKLHIHCSKMCVNYIGNCAGSTPPCWDIFNSDFVCPFKNTFWTNQFYYNQNNVQPTVNLPE